MFQNPGRLQVRVLILGFVMIHWVVRPAAPNFPMADAIGLSPKDKRCVP